MPKKHWNKLHSDYDIIKEKKHRKIIKNKRNLVQEDMVNLIPIEGEKSSDLVNRDDD